jgi:hypothetical protein
MCNSKNKKERKRLYWKKIGLIILIFACLFNIVSKLVKRTTLKQQLIDTAEYVLNQEKK